MASHGAGFDELDGLPDLEELIRLAQEGNRLAMGEVVRRINQKISALAYRLGVAVSDVDDVTQEVWIKVWRRLPTFRWESTFHTWIYRVTYNTVLDHLNRVERLHFMDQRAFDKSPASGIESRVQGDPVADVVVVLAERNEIGVLLRMLKPQYRVALVLADADGLRDGEAADILGISTKAFSSRLARARKAMRELLCDRPQEAGR